VKRILIAIWRGLWSDRYGPHPGMLALVGLLLLGLVAGSWLGLGIMAAVFGPLYLIGAYERGKP